MFTGLVENTAKIIHCAQEYPHQLIIDNPFHEEIEEINVGDSILVSGVCLTVSDKENHQLTFDLSKETLKLTTLSHLTPGSFVNLERAMLASVRFGGHYVTGHVDTKVQMIKREIVDNCLEVTIGPFLPASHLFLLPKGSITVDGVSLTINQVCQQNVQFMLVPHTIIKTTLGKIPLGQEVNIEFDYLTKIVSHQLTSVGYLQE